MAAGVGFTLGVAGLATLLLLSGRVRPDVVGLLVAALLALAGVIPPQQALAGLGSPVVVVLLAVFLLTRALEHSGVTAAMGQRLAQRAAGSPRRLLAWLVVLAALLSLFMNTVAAAAVLLPAAVGAARRQGWSAKPLLLPLAYATLLGGVATLLTTANLVSGAALAAGGYAPYGLLDFLPVGGPVALVGVLFLLAIGPRLLPQEDTPTTQRTSPLAELNRVYRLRLGLYEVRVRPDSPLVGRPARRPHLARDLGLTPIGLVHDEGILFITRIPPERRVAPGDVWLVSGEADDAALARYGLERLRHTDPYPLFRERVALAEVTLNPRGQASGQTPQSLRLRERYGVLALMIWRSGQVITTRVHATPLRPGDALLLQGPSEGIRRLALDEDFVVLEQVLPPGVPHRGRALAAVFGLMLMLLPAALGWLPLALSALLGVLWVFLSGALPPEQGYPAIPWRVLLLIAGMIPLAEAMQRTGAAAWLSTRLLTPLGNTPHPLLLATAFGLLTTALAQVMSGQAAALVLAPIAIAAAEAHGLDPRGLVMAVAVPASFAFLLPTGHPVNLLVMGPGNYRPRDYLRLGLPLTLVVFPVMLLALRLTWLR